MRQLTRVLFIAIFITSSTHEYQKKNNFFYLWRKFRFNNGDGKIKRQSIARPTANAVTAQANQKASTNATLPTAQPSSSKPSATAQKPSVTIPNSVTSPRLILQTTIATTAKQDQHVVVPAPVDVIPVQTVPPQKFLPSMNPPATTDKERNVDANKLNQTHLLLPNLPVYNVATRPQGVQPVIPVKEVAEQTQIKTEMNPIAPLPIITRPTVTVLQHVIGGNPTQVTLQSVVVPKRKYASPPPALSPLPVLPPQTVVPPMRPLKPLAPLPPQEPHIVHHIPILIPTKCGNSHPCGCENDCVGK